MFAKHSVFKISLYSLTLIITLGSILFLYASIVSIITHNPKTLEQLDQQIGMVQNYNFNFKNSRGNLYLKTRNSDIIKYTIRTDDKEIYKKLKFKKVKIYSNSDIFSNYIQQIEDENKTIYKKYNYKAE